MKSVLKKLGHFPVKEKIFLYYMLFFAGISFFTILTNILSGLDFSYNYKWMLIGVLCCLFFIPAYVKKNTVLVHRLGIYSLSLVFLPICWLSSSGLVSPSVVYSVLALIMVNYLTRGWERLVLNAGQILLVTGLICLFYFHPESFRIMSAQEQFIDWIINVPILFIFIAFLLAAFEGAYESERLSKEKKQKTLEKLSVTDSLTGLFTRTHMKERLTTFYNVFKRTSACYSIILIDIDYFKDYNDFYGHIEGDQCLKAVGAALKESACRDTDWLYRYGGEEFVALLGYTDHRGAQKIAKKIQENLKQAGIPHLKSKVNPMLTVSMGISTITADSQTWEQVLKKADNALYQAKHNGRDQIVVDPDSVKIENNV